MIEGAIEVEADQLLVRARIVDGEGLEGSREIECGRNRGIDARIDSIESWTSNQPRCLHAWV